MLSLSSLLSLLLISALSTRHIEVAHSTTHPTDTKLLKDLKNGLHPRSVTPGSCLSSWDFRFDPCDNIFTDRFTCGFRCDVVVSGLSRVTDISLDQAGYSGSLSPSSWDIPYLQTLDLSYNSLSGSLPDSLSNLTRLRRLSLSKNSFAGEIPSSLGSLFLLEELCLDSNRLSGRIPLIFKDLISLKRLELQENNLDGEFPDLSQLRNLYFLDVSDNQIAGKCPVSFPASLIELSMRNNGLQGDLPERIGELGFLQVLDLSRNNLSGIIPSALFDHKSLQQLTLSHNNFSLLQIPDDLGAQSKLIAIDLSHNSLHGLLPAFMASIPKLSSLSLENNRFSGMIPSKFALRVAVSGDETASLKRLLLGGNYLFGPIPAQMMGLKPGSANVSLVDNCLYTCPDTFFFCRGGDQKSRLDCKGFGPQAP
ncbi:leucine-rich repeat (LRR) family protein [Actinidia rufa]|uniref:Leucine-rich repeat (LRR) family protein n=1 Tax=Actinidia rufa TaxID=165716 RepID=A0A7J0GHX2_9ERIC|nr:leucine-rich repeat (LRR) family protein [Actinidia rufa]